MSRILLVSLCLAAAPAWADGIVYGGASSSMSPEMQQAAQASPFLSDAERCGKTCQNNNTPDKHGGKTMCGRAVSEMVQCMSRSLVSSPADCIGKCGNGKDFVECQNGALEKCGYEKVSSGLDKRCSMPGAVLAYKDSPTERGKLYGHVEFICGVDEYCSIYSRLHNAPWPRQMPDACWYPKQKSGAFESLFNR